MKNLRVNHIYGKTILKSALCPDCQIEAFIVAGQMSCCGNPPPPMDRTGFRIELDKSLSRRRRPSARAQAKILKAQGGKCFYCEDEFGSMRRLDGKDRFVKISWDHVIPFSWNGNSDHFVAACSECNSLKSNQHFQSLAEAQRVLKARIHEKKQNYRP